MLHIKEYPKGENAMRYQINQKILSFGDNFTIKDEYGSDQFYVKGKVFALGDKLTIYDVNGVERVYIEQKLLKLMPEYSVYLNGQYAAKVKKEFTFFRPRFHIESTFGQYSIEGDFFGYDFRILKQGRVVASVSKKFFSFRDSYGVEIADDENQALILAFVIIIDQVIHDNNHNDN
ncbi:MAG: hypothetical protein JG775_1549 [Defluviitaleaceae bacterium]|jgi:uncharacterized protein YxjI|nr:hypothetical protein [Defluviitaleaceae bacterium]